MAVYTVNVSIASKSFENSVLSPFLCGVILGIDEAAGTGPVDRRSVPGAAGKEGLPRMLLAELTARRCGCRDRRKGRRPERAGRACYFRDLSVPGQQFPRWIALLRPLVECQRLGRQRG